MFGDDEEIRSDRDLADDYRREIDRQDRLIAVMQADLDAKHAELVSVREAIGQIRELASWHYDPEADNADASPEDNVAHVNGLIVRLCQGETD